jgi:signal transduction histidine kinase
MLEVGGDVGSNRARREQLGDNGAEVTRARRAADRTWRTVMAPHYDPLLVIVSIAIGIMASYVALDLAGRLSHARGYVRLVWWLGGSIAMGVGIWSMHFVGMLAFHLPVPVGYDVPLLLISVLVAVAASALALFVVSRTVLPLVVLMASSLLMGGAINGMHYIGMAAMRLPAAVSWRPYLVLASILIAVTASFVALLLAFRLRHSGRGLFRWVRLWAAVLMGIAISGMHYTGMAAARFTPAPFEPVPGALSLHTGGMSLAVIAGTVLIFLLALAGAAFDERTRLLTREKQARQDAEIASRLKDEFLATLSHELRTPLNVIVGRTQMLRAVAHDREQVMQAVETIARNGEALTRLVEDLLDVSRITLGGVQLEWQSVDLAALVEAAALGVRPAAEAKGIALSFGVSPPVARVMGDPSRLQQVVLNLLTNAVKFTPRGGQIRAEVRDDGSAVNITVSDTGQGIEPAFLPHVWDMFRQGEATASRAYGGLGIGLSIVKRLVELHGGRVSAESGGRGRGATFIVQVPYRPAESVRAQSLVEHRQSV